MAELAAAIVRLAPNQSKEGEAAPPAAPTVEFDQAHFQALAEHVGADALASIIDDFLEETGRLLDEVERAAEGPQTAEQRRLLEWIREAAAALGFSQEAHECLEAATPASDAGRPSPEFADRYSSTWRDRSCCFRCAARTPGPRHERR